MMPKEKMSEAAEQRWPVTGLARQHEKHHHLPAA